METYRILVLGDFHFGESYGNAGARVLREYGYSHSTAHLRPFIDASDSVVLNLETPLVDPETSPSPFEGKKPYVHWGAPVATVNELQKLKVNAVSLANNHTLDHGTQGLESTLQALQDGGIEWFGGGRTLEEARRPYRVMVPDRVGGGEIHFHGSFQYSARYDRDFAFYADQSSAGCAPLSVGQVPDARAYSTRDDSLHVAFPHWGAQYAWRNDRQYRLAHRFLRKDYDLVLGHGAHVLQEVHRKQQRWVVYGLGDGNLQSERLWRKYEEQNGILPFSFWVALEIQQNEWGRRALVKLYPIYSDNAFTNFQPRPVSSEGFDRVLQALSMRPVRPCRFDNPARTAGEDNLGHFIGLDLGEWERGQRPARLVGALDGRDPGEWPLRGPSVKFEDEVLRLDRSLGVTGLTLAARADGASVRWLSSDVALIESSGKRMLAERYRVNESSLGTAIVKDKMLTAELLDAVGVYTPRSTVAHSAETAVEAARAISGPVVIKPKTGNMSKGVSVNLETEEQVREAFTLARNHGLEVIVQEHIEASEEMRVMASTDRVVAVVKRVLPHVVGDGVSTIGQLIEDKNLQRTVNPVLRTRPIPVDAGVVRQLQRQNLALSDVVALGRTVTVRDVGGLSAGADAFQALEVAGAWVKEVATSAIAAVPGLRWGGVDLIIEEKSGAPYVIEINTNAAYGGAAFPTYGKPRNVAREVWRLRHQAAAPEMPSTPSMPEPRRSRPLLLAGTDLSREPGVVSFQSLFEESLERQDYAIVNRNPSVLQVRSPEGGTTWVTRWGRTVADLSVVARVMRRHDWVVKLLDTKQVPRARSQVTRSINRLRHFVEGRVSEVIIMPVSSQWAGPDFNVLSAEEALALESLPGEMWIQARGAGRRVRVLATRDQTWLITTHAKTRPLGEAAIAAAGQIAVDAVQAIPELRWAAVDIVVRSQRLKEGRSGGVLVEGLTMRPVFSFEDQVIAGSFDAFVQRLLKHKMDEIGPST